MAALREKIMEEMTLSGLAEGTQISYIQAMERLARHYRKSPDKIAEQEVRDYLLQLKKDHVARGTFKITYYALKYLYESVLHRDWPLFLKKRFGYPNKNEFQRSYRNEIFITYWTN